ncbi:MAG: hypothetical protein J0M37_15155 [Ignavibacteria bacterium]|nr:hypothetical protein [Ignavibacteria bacterium]
MKQMIFAAASLLTLCIFSSSSYSQNLVYKVTNNSGMILKGVRVSPNDANNWGFNLNISGKVGINQSFEFTQKVDSTNCIYDIRYRGEDDKYYYMQDVDLCNSKTIILLPPTELE